MKTIRYKIISILILLILTGLICDFSRIAYTMESKVEKIFDESGKIISHTTYDFPIEYKILGIISSLCYTLGFSILISTFITHKIENELNKRKIEEYESMIKLREEELENFRKSINNDVFNSLFKTIIPKDIFKVVKHEIIENKIIREDVKWYYDFEIRENDKLTLKQTLKYTLRNTSLSEIINPIKTLIGAENGTKSRLLSAKYSIDNIETYFCINGECNNNVKTTSDAESFMKILEYEIKIPPERSIESTTVIINEYSKNEVHDQYFTRYPIINGTLIVTYPKGYEFKLYCPMSNKLTPDITEETRRTYELKGTILPYQGFIYYLQKKNNHNSTTT